MKNTVHQFGVAQAFLLGLYEENWRIEELKQYGNFGHGTFNGVAGELVVLDGEFYRIDETGRVIKTTGEEKTPIATVVMFEPTHQQNLHSIADFMALSQTLKKEFLQPNFIYALKIEGTFPKILVRSETAQPKPYQPMDISFLPTQRKFLLEQVKGTMMGFFTPQYFKNQIIPGFHFHFIDETKQKGGHVLEVSIDQAQLKWQTFSKVQIFMQQSDEFQTVDLEQDSSKALHAAEKGGVV